MNTHRRPTYAKLMLLIAVSFTALLLAAAAAHPVGAAHRAPATPAAVPVPTAPAALGQANSSRQASGGALPALRPANAPVAHGPVPVAVPPAPTAAGQTNPAGQAAGALPALALAAAGALLAAAALAGRRAARRAAPGAAARPHPRRLAAPRVRAACLATAALLAGCTPAPAAAPQPPAEYLANALNWIEANAASASALDFAAVRRDALALAPNPQTIADTYPALHFATAQLADPVTYFTEPERASNPDTYGIKALMPEAVIFDLIAGGPGDRAGLEVGDVILAVNGGAPQAMPNANVVDLDIHAALELSVRRPGQADALSVQMERRRGLNLYAAPRGSRHDAGAASMGYLELTPESGDNSRYPTQAQRVLSDADSSGACGWVIDVRRTTGGNIWSYLAASGPLLGEGEVGGFVYGDGAHEAWAYRGGKVYWHSEERQESLVEGRIFQPRQTGAPVALLTSPATVAAGELLLVAFEGRPDVRRFGQPTAGAPFLQRHTQLSDGAWLTVSGAVAVDRAGQTYNGPIAPHEVVATDWAAFGSAQDPVILAALAWLASHPACAGA